MSAAPVLFHDSEGWIAWKGGKCPERPETLVRVWLKSIGEARHSYEAGRLNWAARIHEGSRLPGSILGYMPAEGVK